MTWTLTGSLSKKALAVCLAAALTLTPATVLPARADDNADAIAAAAFFGLVAAALIAASRDDDAPARPAPIVSPRKLLPAECRFHIRHGAHSGTWYGRRCLVANYDHWPLLPHRCERRVELPHRHLDITAYKARCLTRLGYWPDDRAFNSRR